MLLTPSAARGLGCSKAFGKVLSGQARKAGVWAPTGGEPLDLHGSHDAQHSIWPQNLVRV